MMHRLPGPGREKIPAVEVKKVASCSVGDHTLSLLLPDASGHSKIMKCLFEDELVAEILP